MCPPLVTAECILARGRVAQRYHHLCRTPGLCQVPCNEASFSKHRLSAQRVQALIQAFGFHPWRPCFTELRLVWYVKGC